MSDVQKSPPLTRCPCCGRLTVSAPVDALAWQLRQHAGRSVYAAQDGSTWIDYRGGQVDRQTVLDAERAGVLRRRWPDQPNLDAWVLA